MYNSGMNDNSGAKFMFWLATLFGFPFLTYQVYCWVNNLDVPILARRYGASHLTQTGPAGVTPEQHATIGWLLLAEGVLFAGIWLYAYMNTYHRGR